ncbi:acetyl-CoA C-acyltransferase [Aeromicrobium sp. SMF47]|uniref:thiolase family protein n=1 Tax=Aeromicrobium TaxID=2040 RepID=UPI00129E3BB9|nr:MULTISPECIES: acetyl-CoA C-acyltransferase [Aeromicrobium]MRJ75037.1 acetyl-CoA C-acyltransferase [Aeromicrobium yanjiei]MRK02907.1 acetyl-CoA C-acyltransferase [Aeromicrobium sp. S22]
MRDAVIVDAVRTPIGRRNGTLKNVHPVDLSAHVLTTLAERNGLDPSLVDDVIWGCVNQISDQSTNVGRLSVLAAGWPEVIPGVTIDRACGSSQQAVHFAAGAVMSGINDIVIAGGVESMSRVPIGSARAMGEPFGPKVKKRYGRESFNQGLGAEDIARRWNLSRQRLDEFAVESHERSIAAQAAGAFSTQLATVVGPDGELTADEGVRPGSTVEKLGTLKTPFMEDGVISAGNSSQISDGSGALLITTSERAAQLGWKPIARFHSGSVVGDDPVTMLTAPIPATAKVLKRAGLTIDDIGVFEVNEAFASVPIAWEIETGADHAKVNPLGGAIGVGHPLGASGAILMTRMLNHMRDNGLRYGLQTMCEAGGMANATILELLEP